MMKEVSGIPQLSSDACAFHKKLIQQQQFGELIDTGFNFLDREGSKGKVSQNCLYSCIYALKIGTPDRKIKTCFFSNVQFHKIT